MKDNQSELDFDVVELEERLEMEAAVPGAAETDAITISTKFD